MLASIKARKRYAKNLIDLKKFPTNDWPRSVQFGWFLIWPWANTGLAIGLFFLELPIHLQFAASRGFSDSAVQSSDGQFLESYNHYLGRAKVSVLTAMILVLSAVGSFVFFGYSVYTLGRPTNVSAVSSSVTINPLWDITALEDQFSELNDLPPPTCFDTSISYSCDAPNNIGLETAQQTLGACPSSAIGKRAGFKFSLAAVPNNATVTKVELNVFVSSTTAATQTIYRLSSDSVDSESCTTGEMYGRLGGSGGSLYTQVTNWNTGGAKTINLGSTAISEVQARISGSDILPLSITSGGSEGVISSNDNGSNKPSLKVSYTMPPEAPTATSHSTVSLTTIGWTWTDNASVETRYDVQDGGNVNVAGCTNLSANTQSCTETGLSTNTQYTRHPNVTDPDGNTNGPTASAYTSIETPAGITFSTVTATSIVVADTGSFSNLTSGSSGILFQENNTTTNSGWLTTNSWTKSGLTANTQYAFQDQARNGDAVVTALTSASQKYTLPATPALNSARSTSTWYSSPDFSFTNTAGWGSGGLQYYRYIWDQVSTHSFNGSESTWADAHAHCPGSTCTTSGPTLTTTATTENNNWYLHVQGYNAEDVSNGTADVGPFFFDSTAPGSPAVVNDGTGADIDTQASTSTVSANWTGSTDSLSGVEKYQYAIGTTTGGQQVLSYTDNGTATSVTRSGLSLSAGTTYYVSVRTIDNGGNIGSPTSSNGVTVIASEPHLVAGRLPTPTPVLPTAGQLILQSRPLFTGNALSGNTIFLFVDGQFENTFKTTNDPSGVGSYAYRLGHDLGFGFHTFSVQARDDASGQTSRRSSDRIFITFPDVPATITHPVDGGVVQEDRVTVAGVAWSSYDVFIFLDQDLAGVVKATPGHGGVGSFAFTSPVLSPGEHTLHVRMRDPIGKVGRATNLQTFTIGSASP